MFLYNSANTGPIKADSIHMSPKAECLCINAALPEPDMSLEYRGSNLVI